ncbi:PREDICTED: uncharacterized protein LOC106106971 isoform X2 [Papilio polytes]|uniref:uncharacterized protein LOC106106971 isoform X2 n=1 Tax=Papilio polytes TaxID=76194 RepID=UPI000675EDE9|nr:PREDICTED: uncharacterized protein LOC106106971 isoform X2 [Papilio polytes]
MESPKPDLVAIYRLEFYKKKKNWKLSDAKKYKRDKISNLKKLLNQTYDVEEPKVEFSQLNNAFLDTESATDIQENKQIKDNTVELLELPEVSVDGRMEVVQNYLDPQTEDVQNYSNNYRYLDDDKYWQDHNGNWRIVPEFDQYYPNDPTQVNGLECGDNAANTLDWRQTDDPFWVPADDLRWLSNNVYSYGGVETDCDLPTSNNSVDSWGEFVRGADVAPHSSEIELTLPKSLSEADVSANSLACLSSAQLRAAVQAHTNLLRSLLIEENQRRRIRSCLSLTNPTLYGGDVIFSPRAVTEASSYDEQPTHDYDASCHRELTREKTFIKTFDDIFLAGSYKNETQDLGRGRGRLQNLRNDVGNTQRAIGVGRGRPCKF